MSSIDRLLEIMSRLRDPQRGCPWDLQQSFATIAPYTIEEAYEVADAIERQDLQALREELGDLLFQVVFHAQMAREQGAFDFASVVTAICDKMERRHPHVFGNATIDSAEAQSAAWEAHKRRERAGADRGAVADEVGDVLFCIVNICRYLHVDPEAALRATNAKFERRFGYVEQRLREQGRAPEEATLEEMDRLWEQGKRQEK